MAKSIMYNNEIPFEVFMFSKFLHFYFLVNPLENPVRHILQS